ncbi:DUF6236 family protein [Streptomyces sp. NPDC048506]|uniref:DUF6236 family protein n=1 Tax=Streptomyces sp. NPDC048506 TaxID=3155028 RepID=UPI003433F9E5
MAILLYYPRVTPPTEVIHQALLYWDGIATVVGGRAVYEELGSRELKDLKELGLYTPLLSSPEHTRRLLGLADSGGNDSFRVLATELRRLATGPDCPGLSSEPDVFLYRPKIGGLRLERLLLSLGLTRPTDPARARIPVPREVLLLITGALAREFAAEAGHHYDRAYVPYTDHAPGYELGLRAAAPGRGVPAWEMELGRLLPVPAPDTPTSEVLAFRERYADERVRLMRALHRMLGDLRRDYDQPADVLAQLRRELTQASEDYLAAVRNSRMAWLSRGISVTVSVAAAATGALLTPDANWILGAIGGYALNVATREVRPLTAAHKEHDFSYLHRVERELT